MPPKPILVTGALFLVQLFFGINYVVSKQVVSQFPALVWADIRIVISTLFMLGIALVSGRARPKFSGNDWKMLVGLACLGTIFNQAFFLVGLKLTTSVNSAVINTLIPVVTLALVTVRGQEKGSWIKTCGFILAFAGVLVIRPIEQLRFSDQTFIGDLLNVGNCVLYACFLSYGKKWMEKFDAIWVTAYLFIVGSIGLSILSIPSWTQMVWPEMTNGLIGSILFAILLGTLAPYFLSFWALKHAQSSKVALFIYIQPVITGFIAWKWFDESVTLRKGIAASMVFTGMLIALSRFARRRQESL
jgi:drug/metabolite transporter (DMT)-like permease